MSGWFAFAPDPDQIVLHPVSVLGYDGSALSASARDLLAAADLVVGGRRHLDAVRAPAAVRTIVMGPVDAALTEVVEAQSFGQRVVVLASGDPGFFGIVRRLAALRLPLVVQPAVSSVTAAFARLGIAWDTALVVSAHGRDLEPALNTWRRFAPELRPVALLTDAAHGPAALIDALGEDFLGCHVFERLGEPDEQHVEVLSEDPSVPHAGVLGPAAARERTWREPLLIVSKGSARGPAPWLLGQRLPLGDELPGWALPDEAFAHRDGMLTKRDVRAAVLARLAPCVGTLVWDIGAGSGSVGIECSRLGAAVVCVERGDVDHLRTNALALHGPVRIVQGAAPAALDGLPHPDAVFVGGGGPEVVSAVVAVRPERVVVALATLERVAPTVAALGGYDVETVLLQISHLQPLGQGHRLVPANPVFVVSGVLP